MVQNNHTNINDILEKYSLVSLIITTSLKKQKKLETYVSYVGSIGIHITKLNKPRLAADIICSLIRSYYQQPLDVEPKSLMMHGNRLLRSTAQIFTFLINLDLNQNAQILK